MSIYNKSTTYKGPCFELAHKYVLGPRMGLITLNYNDKITITLKIFNLKKTLKSKKKIFKLCVGVCLLQQWGIFFHYYFLKVDYSFSLNSKTI